MNDPSVQANRSAVELPAQGTKRAYQACTRCRQRKARCLLPDEAPSPGVPLACLRCRREHKECVFAAERTRKSLAHDQSNSTPLRRTRWLTRGATNASAASNGRDWDSYPESDHTSAQYPQQDAPEHNVVSLSQEAASIDALPDRVSRTVVSTQADALNLLFEAAEVYHTTDIAVAAAPTRYDNAATTSERRNLPDTPRSYTHSIEHWLHPANNLSSTSSAESIRIFSKLKFVKKRWLSAEEALSYVELFFKNMSPLTPILTGWYRDPRNYRELVTKEPVLCTVILTLSSRYHLRHGDAWVSRSFFLHNRLWRYCDSLLQRVFWGQEKGLVSSTRSLGTIEGLLLMAEWHARSLHLPPDTEAWDSDYEESEQANGGVNHTQKRWLEGVVEPMGRSARMSWALIQAAASLSQELGVFDEAKDGSQASHPAQPTESAVHRKKRLKVLVYIYINQIAFRMGYSSLIPSYFVNTPQDLLGLSPQFEMNKQWLQLMAMWVELTAITRTSHDLIFASKLTMRDTIQSGRYRRILGHFKPMLDSWWTKYSNLKDKSPLCLLISVEFLFLKVHIFSLALQAAAESKLNQTRQDTGAGGVLSVPLGFTYEDYNFNQETILNAKALLQIIIDFSDTGELRYMPVRVYVRTISASIFLLKALALGVSADQLNTSLACIDHCAKVMRLHIVDDVHLAGVFASLLETYTRGFRVRFVPVPNISALGVISNNYNDGDLSSNANADGQGDMGMGNGLAEELGLGVETAATAYEWFAHPFEASMAPFGVDFTQPYGVFDGELDFIWNP